MGDAGNVQAGMCSTDRSAALSLPPTNDNGSGDTRYWGPPSRRPQPPRIELLRSIARPEQHSFCRPNQVVTVMVCPPLLPICDPFPTVTVRFECPFAVMSTPPVLNESLLPLPTSLTTTCGLCPPET